jgi:hypothetical protein
MFCHTFWLTQLTFQVMEIPEREDSPALEFRSDLQQQVALICIEEFMTLTFASEAYAYNLPGGKFGGRLWYKYCSKSRTKTRPTIISVSILNRHFCNHN